MNKIFKKIKYTYWHIVPYEFRPHYLLYRIQCFLYKRYSTVKPRYLDHTWVDRDELMLHCMFEILSEFLEKEAKYRGWLDFDGNNATVEVDGKKVNVIDELNYLNDWYHQRYINYYKSNIYIWDDSEENEMLHRLINVRKYLWT